MKPDSHFIKKINIQRSAFLFGAILVNILSSLLVVKLGLPLYLDTIGTIFIAALGGLFPGILTAVLTSVLCNIFYSVALYYVLISVLIAMCTAWFARIKKFDKKGEFVQLILALSLISGVLGTLFQWILLGKPQFSDVEVVARVLSDSTGLNLLFCSILISIGLNLIDKGLSAVLAFLFLYFIPEKKQKEIRNSFWKQQPLTEEEIRAIKKQKIHQKGSLQRRITFTLMLATCSLTVIMVWISINLYFENVRKEYTENALNAAKFASEIVDADKINTYLIQGESAEGYLETKEMLYKIRENSRGVKYLYLVKLQKDGCYFIFDLDSEDMESYAPGEKAEFEEAFLPYLPSLFAGEEIDPIESDDITGWVLTAYYPVRNAAGETVCYAGADVSMVYLSGYVSGFLIKILLIFSGFVILILGYGMWISSYYMIYPINCMAAQTEGLMQVSGELKILDQNVEHLRQLDIHTGDEVERLYQTICKMAADTADQMRDIRYYADATAKMQNGLIITMADMVENRDSDTGAHIQKTAAYVKIILEGLRKKGYYLEKLTPKYMSDVVMSAPLHDVGKINISDTVLNKPGKLTDEEYEIMKTHTTAGKKIMERAINTVQGESYLKEARNMAAYHHERWDGRGYPEKLQGEVIPLSARVMAVADVFDALTSPRVYKPAFPLEKALAIIQEGSGTQFDPKCVEVFMDALPEVKQVLKKYQGM